MLTKEIKRNRKPKEKRRPTTANESSTSAISNQSKNELEQLDISQREFGFQRSVSVALTMNSDHDPGPTLSPTTATHSSTKSSPEHENRVKRAQMEDNDNEDSACPACGLNLLPNSFSGSDSSGGCGTKVSFAFSAFTLKHPVNCVQMCSL